MPRKKSACDCEVSTEARLHPLGHYFTQPRDFKKGPAKYYTSFKLHAY